MKTTIWVIKCLWTIILLILTSKSKLFGVDLLWSDLLIALQIDAVITIILYLITTRKEKQVKSKETILYILFYGEMIKGFGYGLSDLTYQLNHLRTMPLPATILRQTIKVTKIVISEVAITSKDIIVE